MVSGRTSASDGMIERIAVWAVQMRLPMHALTPEAQSLIPPEDSCHLTVMES